ncbi:MAG: hypothetical protein OXN21_03625, partial [Chloroflexota bacterium]|nr:hypothetical protein [Chloroflexota bacterium]
MADEQTANQGDASHKSPLTPPMANPAFARALDELVSLARQGHKSDSLNFNPSDEWLVNNMPVFQGMSGEDQTRVLAEASAIERESEEANSAGRAATKAWPGVAVKLDSGGIGFFSQLGVVRRPDLTQYYVDGFTPNRDALSFSEENQAVFTEVFECIVARLREHLASGQTIIQTDRQICDAPGRSFHARQLLFGADYLQLPYMWRQLTFELPESERTQTPDIMEVSIPHW